MTHEKAVKQANEVRVGIEKDVDDLAAHFTGGIYGEDENGNWIVGYGVSGSANIVVTPIMSNSAAPGASRFRPGPRTRSRNCGGQWRVARHAYGLHADTDAFNVL